MKKYLMKKKKQMPTSELSLNIDLKSMIHEHSLYFDKLVELIPARFYLPTGDSEKPWFQGLSKQAKASAKKESRKNIKKARRDRMDPEKSTTTTLDLLKQSLENDKENADKTTSDVDDVEVEINPLIIEEENEQSHTFETLHRLQQAIAELRASRNPETSNRAKKRIENREYRETHQKKRKRSDGKEEEKTKIKDAELVAKVEKDASEAAKGLSFSHVKLGNDEDEEYGKKKPRMSKSKELEKAKQLEEAKKDPEKGDIIAKKHSLKAAMSRAAGVKIHDDPKLIKQSMHKDKKKHEKNAEKWKERTATKEQMRAEKQKKRSGNIAERINEKKARRIAKREKKLMRPGFEGGKKGFIN